MCPSEEVQNLTVALRKIVGNAARIIPASFGEVDPENLLTLNQDTRTDSEFHRMEKSHQWSNATANDHIDGTSSISFSFDHPLDWTAFGLWLSMLLHARGQDILRVKGMLNIGEKGPVVINGVQHIIHPPQHLDGWPTEERSSTVVFIIRSVDPQLLLKSFTVFAPFMGTIPTTGSVHVSN